ncbi:MAG: hypothetical protein C4297_06645 [Gemmataceae bacterium]
MVATAAGAAASIGERAVDITSVQRHLHEAGIDAWLLYDFRGSNPLARRVLGLPSEGGSRRWFYLIPRHGTPAKLVHRIESGALDSLPGDKVVYLRWQELEQGLAHILRGCRRVAMEYAPRNAIPYVSRVDAGTVELVRSLGVEVVSSGDLVQQFEAVWDREQWAMHLEAAEHTRAALEDSFAFIAEALRHKRPVRESDVQQRILAYFRRHGLVTWHAPIVAVGPHSGDPHYEITPASDTPIVEDALVLVDLWAKLDRPRAVYSDLTWVGWTGASVPDEVARVFAVVAAARDRAIETVRQAFAQKRPIYGYQVDDAARGVIAAAGLDAYFVHRTGHSIGQETHGNGANMDNLETHEARQILPGTCFSIEPGVYLPTFGIRSEVNVFVDWHGQVHVTGGEPQRDIPALLA